MTSHRSSFSWKKKARITNFDEFISKRKWDNFCTKMPIFKMALWKKLPATSVIKVPVIKPALSNLNNLDAN